MSLTVYGWIYLERVYLYDVIENRLQYCQFINAITLLKSVWLNLLKLGFETEASISLVLELFSIFDILDIAITYPNHSDPLHECQTLLSRKGRQILIRTGVQFILLIVKFSVVWQYMKVSDEDMRCRWYFTCIYLNGWTYAIFIKNSTRILQ